jgi:hypothetical protein
MPRRSETHFSQAIHSSLFRTLPNNSFFLGPAEQSNPFPPCLQTMFRMGRMDGGWDGSRSLVRDMVNQQQQLLLLLPHLSMEEGFCRLSRSLRLREPAWPVDQPRQQQQAKGGFRM